MAKIVGPGKWLPLLTIAFGLLSMCTAWVESFGSLIAIRESIASVRLSCCTYMHTLSGFLLGGFEAGLLPGIAFYMSRFYRKNERECFPSALISLCPFSPAGERFAL